MATARPSTSTDCSPLTLADLLKLRAGLERQYDRNWWLQLSEYRPGQEIVVLPGGKEPYMPENKKPYIDYRRLATHIGQLPKEADCGALAAHLLMFDEGAAARLLPAVQALPPGAGLHAGITAVAQALKAENHRLDAGVFWEWCSEDW